MAASRWLNRQAIRPETRAPMSQALCQDSCQWAPSGSSTIGTTMAVSTATGT